MVPKPLAGWRGGGMVLRPLFDFSTTGLVTGRLNCDAIGIELKGPYIQIAVRRLAQKVLALA